MTWTRVTGTGAYFGTFKNDAGVIIHWNGSLPFYGQSDHSGKFMIRKVTGRQPDISSDGPPLLSIGVDVNLAHSILGVMEKSYEKGRDDMHSTLHDDQK